MQAYNLRTKVFGCIVVFLSLLCSSCVVYGNAYYTRKSINTCGCDRVCIDKYLEGKTVDETTYYRICGRL